jgi:hypothetical protein
MPDTFVEVTWVTDELITATKLNQMTANEAGFNTGEALGDGIILTRHIGDSEVSSEKLAATIACRAHRAGAFTYSTEADIVFDTEDFDLGGNFNTSTGRFTAPVTGYYHVNANLSSSNLGDAEQIILRICVNGVSVALATAVGSSAGSDPRISTADIVFLNAGEEIKATATSSASTDGNGASNTFIAIAFIGA